MLVLFVQLQPPWTIRRIFTFITFSIFSIHAVHSSAYNHLITALINFSYFLAVELFSQDRRKTQKFVYRVFRQKKMNTYKIKINRTQVFIKKMFLMCPFKYRFSDDKYSHLSHLFSVIVFIWKKISKKWQYRYIFMTKILKNIIITRKCFYCVFRVFSILYRTNRKCVKNFKYE